MNITEDAYQVKAKLEFLKALNKIQGTIDSVKKDSKNPHYGSTYASLTSVNDTIMGPLTEAGFVVLQGGVAINDKPYLRTTIFHVGGHSESFDYPLLLSDSNPQHLASATSYARRYALCALLNLSVEDDDAETVAAPARASVSPAVAKTFAQAPLSEIRTAQFVPTKVVFVDGTGKGTGKTFSKIYNADGLEFGGNEIQGEIAEGARKSGKEVSIGYSQNGKFLNIKKLVLTKTEESQVEEHVPF